MNVNLIMNCDECGTTNIDLYADDLNIEIDIPNLKYTISAVCPDCGGELESTLPVSALEAELIQYLPLEELLNVKLNG